MKTAKKAILVTGGASGIGLATAKLFLRKGYRLILIDRDATALKKVYLEAIRTGYTDKDFELMRLDLTDTSTIRTKVRRLKFLRDGLDGLVNCAAVQILKRATQFTSEDFDRTWQVNMKAPIVMIQACYPYLRKAQGSVVNVSSIADLSYSPRKALYGASKAFLNSFTRHAAQELGFDGIRVNLVSPGATQTPMMQGFINDGTFSPKEIINCKRLIPMEQRFAAPEEIAEAIVFALTGPRYLHGADIRIDGAIP